MFCYSSVLDLLPKKVILRIFKLTDSVINRFYSAGEDFELVFYFAYQVYVFVISL